MDTQEKPVQYAGFWLRFGAYVIDALIFSGVTAGVSYLLGNPQIDLAQMEQMSFSGESLQALYLQIGMMIAWMLYYTILTASPMQGTIGKHLMKLRVVNLKGERISFIRSFLRYLSYILSALTLLIGFMLAGWTPRKRALHDFIAGTLVIKDEEYVPE